MRWMLLLVSLLSCTFTPEVPKEPQIPERPLGYDILVLVKGEEKRGRLEEITDDEVVFRTTGGKLLRYKREDVQKIRFQKLRVGYKARTVKELKDKTLETVLADIKRLKPPRGVHRVVLYDETLVEVRGDVIDVIRRSVTLALTRRGCRSAGRLALTYLPQSSKVEIMWARTIKTDPKKPLTEWKVIHLDDEYVEDGSVFSTVPEYDRLRRRKFALRSLQPGDVADVSVKRTYKINGFLSPFVFSLLLAGHQRILHKRVEIRYPENAPYMVRFVNPMGFENILQESLVRDGECVFRFVAKDIAALEKEENQVTVWEMSPWVFFARRDGDWRHIARLYFAYLRKLATPTEEIINFARSLKGDPVKAVYRYLACQKSTVGVDFLTYGYDLHNAVWALRHPRLSLPDKAVLAGALLSVLKVEWRCVLLRRRNRGRLLEDVPSLGQFDTVALQVRRNDKWIWFVPEGPDVPLCESPPVRFLVGWMLAEGESEPRRIGKGKPEWHGRRRRIEAVLLPNGDMEAKVEIEYFGYAQSSWRRKMDIPKKEMRNEVMRLALNDDPRAELVSFGFEGLRDPTANLILHYKIKVPRYAQKLGEKGYAMRIPFIRHGGWLAATRKTPMRFTAPRCDTTVVKLHLPKGLKPDYLPERIDTVGAGVVYSFSVGVRDAFVEIKESRTCGVIVLYPKDYALYREVVASGVRASREWLIFRKEAAK